MRARVYCNNQNYNGISAGVNFVDGVGETSIPRLASWFRERGYIVKDIIETEDIPKLGYKELIEYAKSIGFNGIGYKKDELVIEILKLEGVATDDGRGTGTVIETGGTIGTDEVICGN